MGLGGGGILRCLRLLRSILPRRETPAAAPAAVSTVLVVSDVVVLTGWAVEVAAALPQLGQKLAPDGISPPQF